MYQIRSTEMGFSFDVQVSMSREPRDENEWALVGAYVEEQAADCTYFFPFEDETISLDDLPQDLRFALDCLPKDVSDGVLEVAKNSQSAKRHSLLRAARFYSEPIARTLGEAIDYLSGDEDADESFGARFANTACALILMDENDLRNRRVMGLTDALPGLPEETLEKILKARQEYLYAAETFGNLLKGSL